MGIDYKYYFENGIGYTEYIEHMQYEVDNKIEKEYSEYLPLNLQRSKRLSKTIHLNEAIHLKLNDLKTELKWLVISEHWCGDSSQLLPIIDAVVHASNGKIDLRIVYRDQNLPLINAHLTNGGMAIPKLIVLDSDFQFMKEWGPRPKLAQDLVISLKANPEKAANYSEYLHKWYAEDKTISTLMELAELFN